MRVPYDIAKDPPGSNIYRLRSALGLSLRALADRCRPSLDFTTVRRIERNEGYTQDSIERIAVALGLRHGYELFIPPELADWPSLPERAKARLAEAVQDAAAATRYRSKSTG